MTVYVMGDMHGDFDPIFTVLSYMEFKKDDILCLLGDSGLNYDVHPKEKGYIDTNKSFYIKHSLNDGLYRCLGFYLHYSLFMEIMKQELTRLQGMKRKCGIKELSMYSQNIQI